MANKKKIKKVPKKQILAKAKSLADFADRLWRSAQIDKKEHNKLIDASTLLFTIPRKMRPQ